MERNFQSAVGQNPVRSTGLVIRDHRQRPAIAAGRRAEAGDVDALLGDRFGHLRELGWLVLEVHDERIHAGTSTLHADPATGRVPVGPSRTKLYFTRRVKVEPSRARRALARTSRVTQPS